MLSLLGIKNRVDVYQGQPYTKRSMGCSVVFFVQKSTAANMLSGSLKRNSKHALKQCIRPVTTSTYFDMQKDYTGKSVMEVGVNGVAALRIPQINKGAAFTLEERKKLHLSGLLPPTVKTMEQQVERCYSTYSEIPNSIEKYQYLRHLQVQCPSTGLMFAYRGLMLNTLRTSVEILDTSLCFAQSVVCSMLYVPRDCRGLPGKMLWGCFCTQCACSC